MLQKGAAPASSSPCCYALSSCKLRHTTLLHQRRYISQQRLSGYISSCSMLSPPMLSLCRHLSHTPASNLNCWKLFLAVGRPESDVTCHAGRTNRAGGNSGNSSSNSSYGTSSNSSSRHKSTSTSSSSSSSSSSIKSSESSKSNSGSGRGPSKPDSSHQSAKAASGRQQHKQEQQPQQTDDAPTTNSASSRSSSTISSRSLQGSHQHRKPTANHYAPKHQPRPSGSSSSSSRSSTAPTKSSIAYTPRSSSLPNVAQVLVVGAGAAGLTAAYFAAKGGAQVFVVERTREAGKKILMSGGTRCNVMPLEVNLHLDYFTSSSSSALRAVFGGWSLPQCKEWLSEDIGLHLALEKETNKWFPASNSSREVRDKLVAACEMAGVRFAYNASVERISPPTTTKHGHNQGTSNSKNGSGSSSSNLWRLELSSGASVSAENVIFSTGGCSFPAVGTDGTGLNLLQQLGHKLIPSYAALTPLKGSHPGAQQLAGLTLSGVHLSATKPGGSSKLAAVAQRGGLLFTHKGYSGPAVLDLSHWLVQPLDQQRQQQQQQAALPRLLVDWSGEGEAVWQQRLAAASGASTVESLLRKGGVKERLAAALAAEVGVAGRQLSQLRKLERQQLLAALTAWPLPVTGHEGYGKAEVTGGGVVLEEVDCRTMESRILPGLFLCGEVLDVFGRIGGFNFYWAWLTGKMAGQAAVAATMLTKQQCQQQQQQQQQQR